MVWRGAKSRKLEPDDLPARARAEDGMQGAAVPSLKLQVRVRQSNGVEVERVAKVKRNKVDLTEHTRLMELPEGLRHLWEAMEEL